jgi:hypothetical protein
MEKRTDDPDNLFSDEWSAEYVKGFYAGRRYELGELLKNPKPLLEGLLREMSQY